MSLATQLTTAKLNLKNALITFFNSVGDGKTIEESATELSDVIIEQVYDFVKEAEVNIPSLATTVNGVASGSESASGSTAEGNGTLE